jgi:hypothetical protein
MQKIVIYSVYFGGKPNILEESGFGSDESAYAKALAALSDYEDDPLILEYVSRGMQHMWRAAGMDADQLQNGIQQSLASAGQQLRTVEKIEEQQNK